MLHLPRIALSLALAGSMYAQFPGLTLPPSGNNQKASVTQFIGPVRVTVEYSSPAVHGPDGKDRRGQIWGKLVPYGMTNLGFGTAKLSPWRAGANENTVFAVSHEVSIEGKTLPAGRYGLHMIAEPEEWTVIFSKDNGAWGSFFYDEADDALRVQVRPHKNDYREWLTYEFTTRKPADATLEMQWEDLALPISIHVDNVNDIYLGRLRQELTTVPGFDYQAYVAAAQFCLQANTNLDQGLKWADAAISMPFIGQENFTTLSTKARILAKLGRDGEAKTLMQTALRNPATTPMEIHQYGRTLIAEKKYKEAMEVFQYNAQRNGDKWPVHVGLARGFAANGDTEKAIEQLKLALPQAPSDAERQNVQSLIKTLSEGRSIS